MKYTIEHDIPITDTIAQRSEKSWALHDAIKECQIGDSFVVETLRDAQHSCMIALRMGKKANYRKQLDGSRRVWVIA